MQTRYPTCLGLLYTDLFRVDLSCLTYHLHNLVISKLAGGRFMSLSVYAVLHVTALPSNRKTKTTRQTRKYNEMDGNTYRNSITKKRITSVALCSHSTFYTILRL